MQTSWARRRKTACLGCSRGKLRHTHKQKTVPSAPRPPQSDTVHVSETPSCPLSHPSDAMSNTPALGLDVDAFPAFKPLLEACQDYALLTGARFSSRTFTDAADTSSCDEASDAAHQAKKSGAAARAAPTVKEFTQRLQAREPALMIDIEAALRIQGKECTRNFMICVCREFGLWPPLPAPENVSPEDTGYLEALDGPVVEVAQRLFNDESRRDAGYTAESNGNASDSSGRRQAATASFLADFADSAGYEIPAVANSDLELHFRDRVQAWDWKQNGDPCRPGDLESLSTTASSASENEEEADNFVTRIAKNFGTPDNVRRWLATSLVTFSGTDASTTTSEDDSEIAPATDPGSDYLTIQVLLPHGVGANDQVNFTAPDGRVIQFTSAENLPPGSSINVHYAAVHEVRASELRPAPPQEQIASSEQHLERCPSHDVNERPSAVESHAPAPEVKPRRNRFSPSQSVLRAASWAAWSSALR